MRTCNAAASAALLIIAVLVFSAASAQAGTIAPDQTDTFDDGTTANWQEGGPSPNPPTNEPDGGPLGAGDGYLQNVSSGGGGPGSRQIMFNRAQWTGDFAAAEIRQIEFDARNLGDSEIHLRVAFQSISNTRWASAEAIVLPAQSEWTSVTFELNDSAMTMLSGIDGFAASFADVNEFRILSARAPSWFGDVLVGTLGVDNILASTVPIELLEISVE